MNSDDLINSKLLQLLIVLIALIFVSISIYIGFTELFSVSVTDNEYDMSYTDNGILVSQLSGENIDKELNLSILYDDNFERNRTISLHGEDDNTYVPLSDRNENYIESVQLYINQSGEKIVLTDLDSQIEEIEDFIISDFSFSNTEPQVLSADDYISETEMISSYKWEFDDGITLYGETISRDFKSQNEYNTTLTVSDRFNHSKSEEFNINIEEQSETLQTQVNIEIESGEAIKLSGENSISTDNSDIVSYSWDFDDGETYEGESVQYSFNDGGLYTVTLTAEDENGNIHSENIHINVLSDITSDISITNENGFSYTFDASESIIEEDIENVSYMWDFGDGQSEETNNPEVSHTYEDANTYTVTLQIQSEEGVTSQSEIDVTTTVSLEFDDSMPYRVIDVNDGYESVILPNHDLGDEWPEIIFVENSRYEFKNLPSEIEFVNENDDIILSQRGTALYEDNSDVNWVDEENSVSFTITPELGEELFGYQTFE